MVGQFLLRQNFHAKQIYVLSSSLKLGLRADDDETIVLHARKTLPRAPQLHLNTSVSQAHAHGDNKKISNVRSVSKLNCIGYVHIWL